MLRTRSTSEPLACPYSPNRRAGPRRGEAGDTSESYSIVKKYELSYSNFA